MFAQQGPNAIGNNILNWNGSAAVATGTLTAGLRTTASGDFAYADSVGNLGVSVQTNYAAIQPAKTNISIASAGSDTAHNNIPPYTVIQYIIKV